MEPFSAKIILSTWINLNNLTWVALLAPELVVSVLAQWDGTTNMPLWVNKVETTLASPLAQTEDLKEFN